MLVPGWTNDSRRNDQTDHRFRATEPFELVHQRNQRRLRRRGAEHGEQFLLDVEQEADDVETGESGDQSENDEDEEQTGQIEGEHQVGERRQRGDSVLADGEGHGAAGADRRELHDGVHHRKKIREHSSMKRWTVWPA